MIFKISGSLTVIMISFLYGLFCSKTDKFHMEDLRDFKRFFLLLMSEIEYSNTALHEIFTDISEKTSDTVHIFCKNLSEELLQDNRSAQDVFNDVLNNIFTMTYLDNDDKKIISSFGKILKNDDKNQISCNIRTIISYIENKEIEIMKKSSDNMKMYKSLGVLCGLLIAVIML